MKNLYIKHDSSITKYEISMNVIAMRDELQKKTMWLDHISHLRPSHRGTYERPWSCGVWRTKHQGTYQRP
jgi:hypothetical protein